MDNSLGSIPQVPITIKRGGTFYLPINYADSEGIPIDLTDYNARFQIWSSQTASGTALIDIGSYGTNTTFGTIAIIPSLGALVLTIYSSFTITLPNICSKGWSEFYLIDDFDNKIPLFEGPVYFESGGLRWVN